LIKLKDNEYLQSVFYFRDRNFESASVLYYKGYNFTKSQVNNSVTPKVKLQRLIDSAAHYHNTGDFKSAEEVYFQALNANISDSDVNHNFGILLLQNGYYQFSLKLIEKSFSKAPHNQRILRSFLHCLILNGRYEQARGAYSKIGSELPFDSFKKSLKEYEKKIQQTGSFKLVQGAILCAKDDFVAKRYKDVYSSANINLALKNKNLELFNIVGASLRKGGLGNIAVFIYEEALKISTSHWQIYNNLGNALIDIGSFEKATEVFKMGLKTHPNSQQLLVNLATGYNKYKKFSSAIHIGQKLLSIEKNNPKVWFEIGNAYFGKREYSDAVANYKEALALNDKFSDCRQNLSVALLKSGNLEKSCQELSIVLRLDNDHPRGIEQALSLSTQLHIPEDSNLHIKPDLFSDGNYQKSPKTAIIGAIRSYLKENYSECLRCLDYVNIFLNENNGISNLDDRKFILGYFNFLRLLVTPNTSAFSSSSCYVYHIGDSHCLSFATSLATQDYGTKFIPLITFGAKAHHFQTEAQNQYKAITRANIQSIPKNSNVLLSFGEIDCRIDEGFIIAQKKLGCEMSDLVMETIKGYLEWILAVIKLKLINIKILNIPAPVYNQNISHDDNLKVNQVIRLTNKFIKIQSNKLSFEVVDLHEITTNEEGFSNMKYHLDSTHLGPNLIPTLLRYFN
jgi:tetratricopeptide (TPR) repeat protein